MLASGVAAIAVVAVAVGGVALRGNTGSSHPVAGVLSASSVPTPATKQSSVASVSPAPSPPQLTSAAITVPTTTPVPAVQMSVDSFTAVGLQSYWVLGTTPDCTAGCTHVERTSDGGKTFQVVGVTTEKLGLPTATTGTPSTSTVTDIRFADATHGWIYGGALWSSSDAGQTWAQVSMPGLVVDLAAVNGTAWAVVELSAHSGTPQATYAVYRSDYLSAAAGWKKVTLPMQPTDNAPSLAVQGSTAYLLADGGVDGVADVLLTLPVKGAVSSATGPCVNSLPARLSAGASKAILWAACRTGMQSSIHVSSDNGQTWTTVPVGTASLVVGGISATTAILGQLTGPMLILSSTGQTTAVTEPAGALTGFSFIGFTNATEGFAVVEPASGAGQLWRTMDAGHTWVAVSISS
jgi:photosystem II stability/assembly factor-like uncharacterized protein